MPLPAWGFLFWALISAGWALDRSATLAEFPVLILLFATAFCVASVVVDDPSTVRRLLWTYTVSATATALLGLYSYVTVGIGGERISALENQNPAYFAAILLPALVFAFSEFLAGRHWISSAFVSAACTGAIIVSGSRATWLAAAVVVLLFILPRLAPARRVASVGLLAGMLLLVVQIPGVMAVVVRSDGVSSVVGWGWPDGYLDGRPVHL